MSDSKFLPVPSGGKKTGKTFKLEDVLECFSKPALIRELVYLVGGTVVRGEGNDVDVVIRAGDFLPHLLRLSCSDYSGLSLRILISLMTRHQNIYISQ